MKILIISHNPLSTFESMGKTLLELTKSFDKEELAQLYIYPSVPNVDRCSSYFRITDKDVLKSFYKFKVAGKEIIPDLSLSSNFEDEKDEKTYRNPKNKKPLRMCLRDLMWKFSRWHSKDLKTWINKEKPDCILAAPGNAKFLYDIAIKISKKYKIPVFSYLCDEFYFLPKPKKLLNKIQFSMLRKKIKTYYSKYVNHVFCICDNFVSLYEKEFNVKCSVVYTGTSISLNNRKKEINAIETISYLGNIRCKRYLSLAEFGRCIDEINKKQQSNVKIKIYTSEKNEDILKAFDDIKCISIEKFVVGEMFVKALRNSDLLIHTESFDNEFKQIVKNSISTKIADSLASGVPIVAYGPEGIASIDYLIKNKSAYIISNQSQLFERINELINNPTLCSPIVDNALELAKKNHDSIQNSEKVKIIILK